MPPHFTVHQAKPGKMKGMGRRAAAPSSEEARSALLRPTAESRSVMRISIAHAGKALFRAPVPTSPYPCEASFK